MTRFRLELGKKGEDLAEAFLRGKGYRLLERSYRCRLGEIDLVMQDGETLVFVEVKNRSSARFGGPAEAVDVRKQRKLARLAQAFVLGRGLQDSAIRFDVVAILAAEIEHIPDAFRL